MTDNTYGVGTEFLGTGYGPMEFSPFVLEDCLAAPVWFDFVLFSYLCHLESKEGGFFFFFSPVLAEADLISSTVAMCGNFSFRMLFCD